MLGVLLVLALYIVYIFSQKFTTMSSREGIKTYSNSELEDFISLPVHDILKNPIWSGRRFQETSLDFSSTENALLFMKVFTKIVTNDEPSLQIQINKILSEVASDKYFSKIIGLLSRIEARSSEVSEEWLEIFENITKFLQQLCSKIPTSALGSLGLCTYLINIIPRLVSACSDETLNNCLLTIQSDAEAIQRSISQNLIRPQIEKRKQKQDRRKPPNDFREIPILPTRDDIFYEPFLRKNLTDGSYDNLDHYLDVQFRLLREDCIAQLRSGIFEYIQAKTIHANREIRKLQDVKLYKNVNIVSKETSINGPLYEIRLDPHHVDLIRWERSKRLLYGSLLCLSPDDFDTLYFAAIENSDHDKIKSDCTIKVRMRKEKGQKEIPMNLPMTMVESTAYFESYRHVLSSLQTMTEGDLPFKRYIVEGQKDMKLPSYIEEDKQIEYDLGPIINKDVIFERSERRDIEITCRLLSDEWPSAEELHLDHSQFLALKYALTREFAVIQGPPGTGKTHVGLEIAKVLLHNKKHWMNEEQVYETFQYRGRFGRRAPLPIANETSCAMLIVCYTNHALDQFMEGIIKFLDPASELQWGSKLVRVGSRCSNPQIEKFSLKNKRRELRHLEINHEIYLNQLKETFRKISEIKWMLTKSIQNVFGEEILSPWVEEVDDLLKNSRKFNMLKWLKIDVDSLRQIAFKDYEKFEVAKAVEENDVAAAAKGEEMEKIIIETEAALINAERHVEDDDFEVEFKFDEIGVSMDLIAKSVLENGEFDKTFEKLLKDHTRKAKLKILSDDMMDPHEVERTVKKPWKMNVNQRWRMYRYFIHKMQQKAKQMLREEETKYDEIHENYSREKQKIDREILLHSAIIAMTTSGAARYQNVLREVGPRVIIVEEAAEVLEAHIIATLNPNCEHLILIGDHKQLEPKPAVFELAEKYNLALSMFERMINLGLPYVCLERQHRMRPEISQLVRPVYGKLVDNENVFEYEHVKGIEKDVYFISHSKEESRKEETQSYWNDHEALYIQNLTRYLLKQGYTTNQITVLTPYSGQMFRIRDLMPKREFEGIRISILDNYQGEENDLILLSLVRSNKEGKIGFLNRENRVCVALSRAKHGLYVIGNFEIIRKFSYRCKLWGRAIKTMELNGSIGKGLPLYCRNHKSTRIQAVDHEDFRKAPEGGCSLPCDVRRNCGHACNLFCHPRDPYHKEIKCEKSCSNVCERNHKCEKSCHFPDDCMCDVKVEKTLPCGHTLTLPCHMDPDKIKCKERVEKELPCCHSGVMACFENPLVFICKVVVERELNCGHVKELPCNVDFKNFRCNVIVLKKLKCEHDAEMYCWKRPCEFKCEKVVHRVLSCNHEKDLECHVDVKYYKCMEKVIKQLPCSHECELQCHENVLFVKCQEDVTEKRKISLSTNTLRLRIRYFSTTQSSCEHLYTRKCHENPLVFQRNNPCKELIKKELACGHEIEIACHRRNDEIQCQTMVMTNFQCHHENISVPCHLKVGKKCHSRCGQLCEMKHECQQECHFPDPCTCKENVKKQKECGHRVATKCYKDVSKIDCEEPVEYKLQCGHVKILACKVDIDIVQCNTNVVKQLKCQHTLSLPCYTDPDNPSIKCSAKTKKVISSCGHEVLTQCYKNPESETCKENVIIARPDCGHDTEILCNLKKKLQAGSIKLDFVLSKLSLCKTPVTVMLACGHSLKTSCSQQETKNFQCKEPCTSVLSCGHLCKGSCSECKSNFHHKECQKNCDKLLVCGHQCKTTSCGGCVLCPDSCSFGCSHFTCTHPCKQVCELCTKPCDWTCIHYKCSKQCFEVCDRPKCNERCTKKLTCGHQCVGFCGDPCPKLCKKCNHKEVMRISKAKGSLFVQLQDCGHIFDSKFIDEYMESVIDVFSVKQCPKCSRIIKWHPRYHIQLKNQNIILNKIRSTIDSVSRRLHVSVFPLLVSDGENCFDYLKKFGTFSAANEQSLQQDNDYLLTSAKSMLQSLKHLIQQKNLGNQAIHTIYAKIEVICAFWKLFIVMHCNEFSGEEESTQYLGIPETETSSNSDDDSEDDYNNSTSQPNAGKQDPVNTNKEEVFNVKSRCKEYARFKRNLDVLQDAFVRYENGDENWARNIEGRLKYFMPFLTDIGKAWTLTADKFPRLIAAVDIHAETWKMCKHGKYTANFTLYQSFNCAVMCNGLMLLNDC